MLGAACYGALLTNIKKKTLQACPKQVEFGWPVPCSAFLRGSLRLKNCAQARKHTIKCLSIGIMLFLLLLQSLGSLAVDRLMWPGNEKRSGSLDGLFFLVWETVTCIMDKLEWADADQPEVQPKLDKCFLTGHSVSLRYRITNPTTSKLSLTWWSWGMLKRCLLPASLTIFNPFSEVVAYCAV